MVTSVTVGVAVHAEPDGLLGTMPSGGTVMVCSTIALSELGPIADAARARGVTVLDNGRAVERRPVRDRDQVHARDP